MALIISLGPVFLVNPDKTPLALESQYGAPNPTKAGTKYTPLLLLSDFVTYSVSLAFLINFILSLAH